MDDPEIRVECLRLASQLNPHDSESLLSAAERLYRFASGKPQHTMIQMMSLGTGETLNIAGRRSKRQIVGGFQETCVAARS